MARMTRAQRPSIKSPCVADQYHAPDERIAEIHFPKANKGALLALREHYDPKRGTYYGCTVEVYRADEGIILQGANAQDWTGPRYTGALDLLRRMAQAYGGLIRSEFQTASNPRPEEHDPILAEVRAYFGQPLEIGSYPAKVDPPAGLTQPAEVWAAYAGSAAGGDGITLHTTERAALEACATTLGIDFGEEGETPTCLQCHTEIHADGQGSWVDDTDGDACPEGRSQNSEVHIPRGPMHALDDDALRERIEQYCENRADDWYVGQVELP